MTLPDRGGEAQKALWIFAVIPSETGHAPEDREVSLCIRLRRANDEQARLEALEPWHRWRQFALNELGIDPSKGKVYEERMEHFSYDKMAADNRAVFGGPETCVRHLKRAQEILQPTHIGLVFHSADKAGQSSQVHGTLCAFGGTRFTMMIG
jgi:alkanesulfonate monooxygenase SsuD/methylene tetrahydromethanopterin reductase-like flavin-dependent oxidoreductase (luciferase family)